MTTTKLSLEEIYKLAFNSLITNGCDAYNAQTVATTVTHA